MEHQKIHFKNFDALRGIAASMVVFAHIELQKAQLGHIPFTRITFQFLGTIGVALFLVLSGFLITFLLIEEKTKTQDVSLKKFYIRRVLRIWPLYFLMLIAGKIICGADFSNKGLILSIFFMSNVAFMKDILPFLIDPTWTIGIEEQFYIGIPQLVKRFSHKIILIVVCIMILFLSTLGFTIKLLPAYSLPSDFMYYLYKCSFDLMFLGVLGAILYQNERYKYFTFNTYFNLIYSNAVQIITYTVLIVWFVLYILKIVPLVSKAFAVLFLISIINLGTNPKSLISLENKVLNYLGKISFGLYLTHKFMIYLVLKFIHIENAVLDNIVIYSLSYLLSVGLATLLFEYFESFFLRYKNKFSTV